MYKSRCINCPQLEEDFCCVGNFERSTFTYEEIHNDIFSALKLLYKNDKYLLEQKVNERSISGHFATYFTHLFSAKYNNLNIDSEYNKNGDKSKFYKVNIETGRYSYAIPDMIIHKRNCNSHNKLYLEIKPYWNTDTHDDIEKIIKFTDTEELFCKEGIHYSYKFEYGVSIILYLDKIQLEWFSKGKSEPFANKTVDISKWK